VEKDPTQARGWNITCERVKMLRCMLCWSFTRHEADYVVTFGHNDRELKVCRYCIEDLTLLGFKANQIVRLEASKPLQPKITTFWFLGPIQNVQEASEK